MLGRSFRIAEKRSDKSNQRLRKQRKRREGGRWGKRGGWGEQASRVMVQAFPVSQTTKAYLEPRFGSSEPVTKRTVRKGSANTSKRGLAASRVVVLVLAPPHHHAPALARCTIESTADKVNSQCMQLIAGDVGEVHMCLWLKASSLKRLIIKGDLYLTCLMLECYRQVTVMSSWKE